MTTTKFPFELARPSPKTWVQKVKVVPGRYVMSEPPAVDAEKLAHTCPNCDHALTEQANQLVCGCGYYVSAGDFY